MVKIINMLTTSKIILLVKSLCQIKLKGTKFYEPGNNSRENILRDFLKNNWKDKYGY